MADEASLSQSFTSFWLLVFLFEMVSSSESRKGYFANVDPSDSFSSKTVLLKAAQLPSDLACSQKCFANRLCSYKSFDFASGHCKLFQMVSSADSQRQKSISKKIQGNPCVSRDCGNTCECNPLLGTEEYACDCAIKGQSPTSPDYVHRSCLNALISNNNITKTYYVQPSLKHSPVSLTCERSSDGKADAVFHHNSEAEVTVTGYADTCGGYTKTFVYEASLRLMEFVIKYSVECRQKTTANCLGVEFVQNDCTWLKGRDDKKLRFWGGGPQDGIGCQCGVTNTCVSPGLKCNCDLNNNYGSEWQKDEGYVTLKSVLPLAGIAIGDTQTRNVEVVKYIIGPLKCTV